MNICPDSVSTMSRATQPWHFSSEDREVLDIYFSNNPYPKKDDRLRLAKQLQAPERVIMNWFHNKRNRTRRALGLVGRFSSQALASPTAGRPELSPVPKTNGAPHHTMVSEEMYSPLPAAVCERLAAVYSLLGYPDDLLLKMLSEDMSVSEQELKIWFNERRQHFSEVTTAASLTLEEAMGFVESSCSPPTSHQSTEDTTAACSTQREAMGYVQSSCDLSASHFDSTLAEAVYFVYPEDPDFSSGDSGISSDSQSSTGRPSLGMLSLLLDIPSPPSMDPPSSPGPAPHSPLGFDSSSTGTAFTTPTSLDSFSSVCWDFSCVSDRHSGTGQTSSVSLPLRTPLFRPW